jgi:DNA recombination protein RmuC
MERTKRDYEDAMRRLCTGSGNVVRRAERLRELGANVKRDLDRRLLDRAGSADDE